MDDFGSGYSSLNNIKDYVFDVLKIDMNFLRSFETNSKSAIVIRSIVNMAKELGMHTLAEGVETEAQFEFLREIGCEKVQGLSLQPPDLAGGGDCLLLWTYGAGQGGAVPSQQLLCARRRDQCALEHTA